MGVQQLRASVTSMPSRQDGVQASLTTSAWSVSAGKRIFDLCMRTLLFALMLPLLGLLALAVSVSSPGPVLFRHRRLGRGGREFELLKFRSMQHHPPLAAGPPLTRGGDERVTPLGRVLRRTKLDELPQLMNVIRGDMSLVGPRPDVARYIRRLAPRYQAALRAIRPGITGAASRAFYREEELLATVKPEELERFYVTVVLPQKAATDLNYAARATLWSDIRCLLST